MPLRASARGVGSDRHTRAWLLPLLLLPTREQVLDTCSDSDCGGCCTRNARHHGGVLIDLEYHTARRFWGEGVHRMGEVQWQLAA